MILFWRSHFILLPFNNHISLPFNNSIWIVVNYTNTIHWKKDAKNVQQLRTKRKNSSSIQVFRCFNVTERKNKQTITSWFQSVQMTISRFLLGSKEWRFSRQWVITFLPKYFDVKTHAFSQCWHVEASVVKRKICDEICRRWLHQQRVHFPIGNLKKKIYLTDKF